MADGTNTRFSTVLMVLRDTRTSAARSACERPRRVRSSLRRFPSSFAVNVYRRLRKTMVATATSTPADNVTCARTLASTMVNCAQR